MKKLLFMFLALFLLSACSEVEKPIPENKILEYPKSESDPIEQPTQTNEQNEKENSN